MQRFEFLIDFPIEKNHRRDRELRDIFLKIGLVPKMSFCSNFPVFERPDSRRDSAPAARVIRCGGWSDSREMLQMERLC